MNGSTSPRANNGPTEDPGQEAGVENSRDGTANAQGEPEGPVPEAVDSATQSGPARAVLKADDNPSQQPGCDLATDGDVDDAVSEAETLIDSPVKKREAEKRKQLHTRRSIGGLPVPGEDDEESESVATPLQSTETIDHKITSGIGGRDTGDEMDLGSDKEGSSDPLSSAPSPASTVLSLISGRSRAMSESLEGTRNDAEGGNSRKRKHRASSAEFSRKRQSIEPPNRDPRGIQSEDTTTMPHESVSPKLRSHRRAASTQSALLDGTAENPRPRRGASQFPVREPKTRSAWEDDDVSSETASHGHADVRRAQRGIGRSTSTPGRPVGRELKRHVNRYGFTRLAEACDHGDLDLVKQWRERDPDQLEVAEYAQNKPLQIASLRGNAEIVQYLVDQGCKLDCANVDKDTPLIDAAENGHVEVVKILLDAGVDPLGQNLKGQQALDVVKDDEDNADEIRVMLRNAIETWNSDGAKLRREEDEEARHQQQKPNKEIHFMARTHENLLRLIAINDRKGVKEFLDARVPVDNAAIAAAARTGDQYLVNMLLAELSEKQAFQKPEKPMLAVLGTSHLEMVRMLSSLDQFKPLWKSRSDKTWAELAEERGGPHWREEKELFERLRAERAGQMSLGRSSSPVTKRESSKRRLPPQHQIGDESDEETGPKPKNGRRLMSRRAMRAQSSKAMSESESDEASTSDSGTPPITELLEHEEKPTMQPPGSPSRRKPSVRQRTKSVSSQPQEILPRTRRRSSSLRGLQEHALPVVHEHLEDKENLEAVANERAKAQLQRAEAQEEKQRRQAVEADAKQAEEVLKAEARRKEEEVRRADQERQAQQIRKEAEGLRQREAESQARKVEEEKRAEEDRRLKEVLMESARRDFCRTLLDLFPGPAADYLDPETPNATDIMLPEVCIPLFAIRVEDGVDRILNVQAALLMGTVGVELMYPRTTDNDKFARTCSKDWDVLDLAAAGVGGRRVQQRVAYAMAKEKVMHETSRDLPDDGETMDLDNGHLAKADFAAEVRLMHHRLDLLQQYQKSFLSTTATLEFVRLSDVLGHLDPVFNNEELCVRYLPSSSSQQKPAVKVTDENPVKETFISGLQRQWAEQPAGMRWFRSGKEIEVDGNSEKDAWSGVTNVRVFHEKWAK
ncbi:hypothetical protein LTR62_006322 [Meristemomyces frigidus]|uniref:Uncharacterized protein n=1 Tax=Meristemomyces frigidus TaxID=1508187 RepID=A0AAN7TCJ0_9PEZI|nr:hypothetical protein LTR62_006322 [Meristemomyces frigidus]